jgi:Spy/CpxP family protein refolding chaperone
MMNKLAKLLPLLSIVLAIPTLAVVAHARPHQDGGRIAEIGMGHHMDDFNLTAAQKTKMEQLRQSARTQIDGVLTAEQRQKFQQIASQHQARQQAGEGLNLTADQKLKMKAIHQEHQKQFQAILTPAQLAQLKQDRGNRSKGGLMARFDKLNLTSEQKAKLEQLKTTGKTQMDAILTPEQRQKAQAMHGQRSAMGTTWKSLNLTADQQAKIKAIRQTSEQQLNAILTPEQQSKLKSGHHGRRNHSM